MSEAKQDECDTCGALSRPGDVELFRDLTMMLVFDGKASEVRTQGCFHARVLASCRPIGLPVVPAPRAVQPVWRQP
jgi:hypothetical protein